MGEESNNLLGLYPVVFSKVYDFLDLPDLIQLARVCTKLSRGLLNKYNEMCPLDPIWETDFNALL